MLYSTDELIVGSENHKDALWLGCISFSANHMDTLWLGCIICG
jgi:hypothetical protein